MISIKFKTLALQAAIKAGREILKIYKSDFDILLKNDESPVTKADVLAHKNIYDHLQQTGIPILSEEGKEISFEDRKKWKQFWMVDPLDGTKEFINGNDEFTINIALIENNKPVFGVIYVPVMNKLFAGGKLKNSYSLITDSEILDWEQVVKTGNLLSRKRKKIESLKLIKILTSRSHLNLKTLTYIEKYKKNNALLETVGVGSSLKFCLLAAGEAHLYPRFSPCMEWDTAAGDAICQGVGLQIIDLDTGSPLNYNKKLLLNPNFEVIQG